MVLIFSTTKTIQVTSGKSSLIYKKSHVEYIPELIFNNFTTVRERDFEYRWLKNSELISFHTTIDRIFVHIFSLRIHKRVCLAYIICAKSSEQIPLFHFRPTATFNIHLKPDNATLRLHISRAGARYTLYICTINMLTTWNNEIHLFAFPLNWNDYSVKSDTVSTCCSWYFENNLIY